MGDGEAGGYDLPAVALLAEHIHANNIAYFVCLFTNLNPLTRVKCIAENIKRILFYNE